MTQTKTALVTGANRGIGLAIARGLAARGDIQVLAASRKLADAQEAARYIGSRVKPVELDLSSRLIREQHVAMIMSAHPQIDILINNAGVLENGNLLALEDGKLEMTLQVNYLAVIDLVRAFVPGMISRGYGRVVNLSSGWGSFEDGLTGPPSYSMTKAALNGLTLSLSHELPTNVKVNSCCPGWVKTRMGGSGASLTPEQGADTPIWLATLPDDGPSGGFFRRRERIAW